MINIFLIDEKRTNVIFVENNSNYTAFFNRKLKIFISYIVSAILAFVFVLGPSQFIQMNSDDDTMMVSDMDNQDSQDDSDSSVDEDVTDFDFISGPESLTAAIAHQKLSTTIHYLFLNAPTLNRLQPTPPPEKLT
ncbi:hypothetical protein Musp01_28560 [Muricauda sp. NBRC 101325]|nr:hypothetical protein Musp01_28560 [Muricauda sp. NBRC 101325]